MALTDPMIFEDVRDALEALLVANQSTAGAEFQTITEQKQKTAAELAKGILRNVQIYYSSGDYSRDKSTTQDLNHAVNFTIDYLVSEPAIADLSALDNPEATALQKATALQNMQVGTRIADRSMDTLRRVITKIILAPNNRDLGMQTFRSETGLNYEVSDAWLSNFRKNQPINNGGLVVVTATEQLSFTVTEVRPGVTPTPAVAPTLDILYGTGEDFDFDTDPQKTGIQTAT